MGADTPLSTEYPSLPWRSLWPILIFALALRLVWLVTQTSVIENEGAEYARIAQNLRDGFGYSGTMRGAQLLFPPVYPVLIAGLSFLTGNIELAARLISVAAGVLLVIPVFLLSEYVHGRRAACISALLVTLYPVLVALSASTFSECLYSTLLLAGICCALLWQGYGKTRDALLAGLFLGLAYLTRPEAMVFPVALAIVIPASALLTHRNWKRPLLQSGWMLICVAALASPYVAYLWRHTGHFRLEGKSEVNYLIGARLNSGIQVEQAAWGLDQNGVAQGPLLDPNRYLGAKLYPRHLRQLFEYFLTGARRNFWVLRHLPLFSPLFWPLLLVAVFAFLPRDWTRLRAERELLLICLFALACLPLAIGPVFSIRRLALPIVPFALLWPSKGIAEISARTQAIFSRRASPLLQRRMYGIIPLGIGLLLVYSGQRALRQLPELLWTKTDVPMKEAGLWLSQYDPAPKRVMDSGTIVSYYSGGTWMPMPWGEPSLIMKYIHSQKPDFVVVKLAPQGSRTSSLSEELGRDPAAEFLHEFGSASGGGVRLYRWTQ